MKKVSKHRAFLFQLSKKKNHHSIIDQASVPELTVLSEICKNVGVIPFTSKERQRVMKHIEQVRALGKASRARLAKSIAHYLARSGVLQILITASFERLQNL